MSEGKKCFECVHWVMCKWKLKIDGLSGITSVSYAKSTMFTDWRNSFAELCDYHALSKTDVRVE